MAVAEMRVGAAVEATVVVATWVAAARNQPQALVAAAEEGLQGAAAVKVAEVTVLMVEVVRTQQRAQAAAAVVATLAATAAMA